MVLTGKRSYSSGDQGRDAKNPKRRANGKDESGNGELVVYRILCPDGVIGSVIGKNGKVINSIRQETRAKVKVVDPFPGAKERVLTIYCYVKDKEEIEAEEYDLTDPLCPSQDALLKVQSAIANALSTIGESDKKHKDKEECRILVPSSQSASVIGKAGVTIKKLRSKTRTSIMVNPKDPSDPTHSCAMHFDNFVTITGDSEAVKKALFAVSAIMYKFPPREEIPLDVTVPEAPPGIIVPSDMPIYPSGGFYPAADTIIPPRSVPSLMDTAHVAELPGYADSGSAWPIYSTPLPVVSGYSGPSRSEEISFRVLCPASKIGRVIGKGGSSIKSLRQSSGARIEVDDTKNDHDDCVISVASAESTDDLKSTAAEAVLLLQGKINDEFDDVVTIRLLIPSKVVGCLIGKSGSIINEIRKRTRADIRISKGERPLSADANEEFVEVVGEVGSVRDALVQIVLRLRDGALKDKDGARYPSKGVDSLYSSGSGHSVPPVSSLKTLSYDQRAETDSGLGMLSSSSLYGYGSLSAGVNGYGSVPSYSSNLYGGLTTVEMPIPANAVNKVTGKGGAVLSNIRKISGASIEISESKYSRGDYVAYISGTSDEKSTAEKLIQAFMMAP